MNLATTIIFYLLFGAAVAVAVHHAFDVTSRREHWFRTITALLFWPLYVPALLQCRDGKAGFKPADGAADSVAPKVAEPSDEIARTIQQVEAELDVALSCLDGWSDAVLAREQHRFDELRMAWHAQADKIRELDALLAQPAFATPSASPLAADSRERAAKSVRARDANVARLQAVRRQLHDDLLSTLAWVRELVTMIHLAKYTGAPASRAEELVMQIATSIEGLSEVAAWRDAQSPAMWPGDRPPRATVPPSPRVLAGRGEGGEG